MSTNDVPGANPGNLDQLALGCWAESPDGSLIFVMSTEGGRVIYDVFDVQADGKVLTYRDAMPQKEFDVAFSWKADKAKAGGKAAKVPDIRWTWHDKTPFPWDRVIKQGAKDGQQHASADDLISDAEKVRRSRDKVRGKTLAETVKGWDDEDEDQADREALDRARDRLAAGRMKTRSHEEVKDRLGLKSDAERVAEAIGAAAREVDPESLRHLFTTFGSAMQRIGKALKKLG